MALFIIARTEPVFIFLSEMHYVTGNLQQADIIRSHNAVCVSAVTCNKKLSYCWETVRRESMPRIAEMDMEMTT